MSTAFLKILQKFFLHVLFGADLDDTEIELQVRSKAEIGLFEARKFTVSEAIEECA